jgi:VanZ family protein
VTGDGTRGADSMMERRLKGSWLMVAAAYVALIFFMSSRPYLHAPGPDFDMKDKLAHLCEYGILGGLLARSIGRGLSPSRVFAVFLVVATGATLAGLDEMYQGTVPGRLRDVSDWLADVAGIVIGASIAMRGRKQEFADKVEP